MKENISKLMVKMFPRIGSGCGQLEKQLPTPLRIKLNPKGGVGVLCKVVKGSIF